MLIYSKNDYREILKEVVAERKKLDASINFQQMSEYVRVPKSYLSRVIHGKAELSTDQMFLICHYLEFSEKQRAYMMLLLEFARTSIKVRREQLQREIKAIRDQQLDIREHLKASPNDSMHAATVATYYLEPFVQITHISLFVPRYQKDQSLLAHDLKVPVSTIASALSKLEQMGFIARTARGIEVLADDLHLPKTSLYYKSWRNHMKLSAMQRLNSVADDRAFSFTVVISTEEDVRREIQAKFLSFLKETEQLVKGSRQEGTYQMSFDLFPWTRG